MIGVYYRLSLSDEDINEKKKESNSIANQRKTIQMFLETHPEWKHEEIEEYIDDGFTGTSMERPAFQRMMQDVRNNQIKTIIVKDFSRFARDYIEAGDYIERIFPFMGVRFISINDYYDSESTIEDNGMKNFEMVVKNIVNTAYSRDISAKISATDRTKQKQGLYLGGYRAYGFLPDPSDKHKVIVDPVAGKYVRMIFDLAIEGKNTKEIAVILNERGIPTAAKYQIEQKNVTKEQSCWKLKGESWTRETVLRILRNERYKGTYVAREIVQVTPCKKARMRNPEDKVVKIENAHDGIVTPEEYEQAIKVLRTATRRETKRKTKYYPLKGKVVCGYCGRHMVHFEQLKRGNHFRCRYGKNLPDGQCQELPVQDSVIEDMIRNSLSMHLFLFDKALDVLAAQEENILLKKSKLEKQQEALYQQMEDNSREKVKLYEQYSEGEVEKEVFINGREAFSEKDGEIRSAIQKIQEEKKKLIVSKKPDYEQMKQLKKDMDKAGSVLEVSMEIVESFVSEIRVYNQERIEIIWKYDDEILQILAQEKETMEVAI
ncbi:recombinase family protein [Hespellia stercorisuis]|uniref:Site-specific DNA recombinase n=1 Tax=Hespellia stercorisuis DSM 15480 TaxID=1121950 RepID=A0A1M6TKF7_9FIRM|nr:recombinase family protein [Hespellia stercorisuis]SHK57258.1 Site-specific DNA recombinase [Hespellia stercorisuis DSM 15480]